MKRLVVTALIDEARDALIYHEDKQAWLSEVPGVLGQFEKGETATVSGLTLKTMMSLLPVSSCLECPDEEFEIEVWELETLLEKSVVDTPIYFSIWRDDE